MPVVVTLRSARPRSRENALLSCTGLACSRGGRTLFSGLGFVLPGGRWLRVEGANGSGKTTLLRTLTGLAPPERGQVCWDGRPLAEAGPALHGELLYIGHAGALKDDFTPLENLQAACAVDGQALPAAQAQAALVRLGMGGRARVPVRCLSAGQRRRTLLARLLARRVRLWVLDEPFAALDGEAVALVCGLLREHLAAGGSAVLTSHQPVALDGGAAIAL